MLEIENTLRILAFSSALVIFLLWETFSPRQQKLQDYYLRCLNNLSLIFFSSILIRIFFPLLVLSTVAMKVNDSGWGLFNYFKIDESIEIILSIIILDLIIYLQHVATHHIPWLWRLHRVHHSDRELNVTTGVRFHPIEIILSLLIKALATITFGISLTAVVLFEVILNIAPMFNHANIRIPRKVDSILRKFLVTPDMHLIHHSTEIKETNSNYGFFLPWWDWLFHTYKEEPGLGYQRMHIGLDEISDSQTLWLHVLLLQPFSSIVKKNHEEKT